MRELSQLKELAEELSKDIESAIHGLKLDEKEKTLTDLKEQMSAPDFWQLQDVARDVSTKASSIEKQISKWKEFLHKINDLKNILNDEQAADVLETIEYDYDQIKSEFDAASSELLFSEKYDDNPAIVTINAGAGGDDAQDWAAMLERMYLRYCESKGWQVTVLARSVGSEAGIKSATFRVSGELVYGHLKNESGVHRLVRLSPFDADNARHTSFAMVEVLPEILKPEVQIKDEDIKIDVFRSSGAGGQSVNKTESAVRITHLPTGISASCQNERSQQQNRKQAMIYLLSKLEKYEASTNADERQLLRGEYTEAAWGNQIRSYVLHPYKMVKDHRTNFESKEPDTVLEGDLDAFIFENLKKNHL